ncbi:chloride channel protein [Solemya velesiana gill symbiont]|uniref:chloride channel protein n=1 Tax=Solemya velesiana gill symbiont TaxID=1918948 RepID=UPI001FE54241|nr:chloride channel protein [Solemya velesiana gill symbiont]
MRLHLSRPDALIQLALLGLVTGLLAGGIIVAFRVAVEGAQAGFLPGGLSENYEALPLWARFLLPVVGGAIIGWIFYRHANGLHVLGVARVMERMAYHQGHLTLREFVLQFVGAAVAIISGHSVGREGSHIYLGAASGSLLGQYLTLPNNSIRTMVGCGTAAGIAASFNTPLAGVIFALEVVMMEYTLASFIPVILAAVSATAVSYSVFGGEPAFAVPEMQLGSLGEMPLVLLLGLVVGMFSSLFNQMIESVAVRARNVPFWWRATLAGVIVGLFAMVVPEVMGIGYDTVNAALLGEIGLALLAVLTITKLLATVASVGMGIPGGMIGPSLFIGATLGSLMGLSVQMILPQMQIDVSFYALLGMGAMMGASLQAPLAALTAMMELTHSPQIIMPGMLVIVVAALTASELFRKESLFITMLKASGLDYNANPVMQALRRIGVASVMGKSFERPDSVVERSDAETLLEKGPEWLLVQGEEGPVALMPALDLARFLQENQEVQEIDLMAIPARRDEVAPVHIQATLQEAMELLESRGVQSLYVERTTAPGIQRIYGVLTREQVESAYRY